MCIYVRVCVRVFAYVTGSANSTEAQGFPVAVGPDLTENGSDDVIVDDTPGVVIVSAFDAVRREVARLSLVKLIQDGRIHPSRIEEVVAKVQKEVETQIVELGEALAGTAAPPRADGDVAILKSVGVGLADIDLNLHYSRDQSDGRGLRLITSPFTAGGDRVAFRITGDPGRLEWEPGPLENFHADDALAPSSEKEPSRGPAPTAIRS